MGLLANTIDGPERPIPLHLGPTKTSAKDLTRSRSVGIGVVRFEKKVWSTTCPLNGSFQSPNCPLKGFFHSPNGIFLVANGRMAADFSSPGPSGNLWSRAKKKKKKKKKKRKHGHNYSSSSEIFGFKFSFLSVCLQYSYTLNKAHTQKKICLHSFPIHYIYITFLFLFFVNKRHTHTHAHTHKELSWDVINFFFFLNGLLPCCLFWC